MKLLIVEDDPLIGPSMKVVLRQYGHSVIGPVRTAAKALRVVERGSLRPDLALVDYHLAGGENGLSLVRALKEQHGVPALLVTGYDHRGEEARGIALGCLVKPFLPEALEQAVAAAEEVLAGHRPSFPPAALILFDRPPLAA
ncbi:response regulator [Azospirillum soli]|uniref:response regulator n=1 Tax=Azospirillum soli TaxID=1304799 RepID=UPI001AE77D4C|nr:response regulator [Azospirillum soli]MBP2312862.1 DNA-binding response OmpR family regulator [Azospirillum soli]